MKLRFIVGGVVLLLILGGAFVYAHVRSLPAGPTIRMTKNGFEPEEVTIQKGMRVTWVNEDSVPRWPASNLHPTHGIYPEFDPLEGIPPGASWSFVFDRVGSWRFHDHLLPQMKGTVYVGE
ncbi:MAG: hypothetical protein A3C84_00975 [Candidatus Ryanbacteria bacterium RIFCSPHIGHO2_02_FULL_48_12]|uniref:Uncharacterized protein n=1 Tax=Candidatus Ryanbacteria bacterium RIFCSPHIGHO2_01_FULL_48_27 TaxID=1802115 RepID=A0A1G2G4X6_9BACT|nr:MAG: hypothetical protein A2756_03485 [Candidatus Ryanbacteria bacterium RIFCSPHIGHO2_01_FULL_48_27]OGZ50692.1 MAG: hypothetical protein A3C84_00975 [Candidatus Ryanbacteria bacterium RIFCSPHIGHO2_02_FULL_48_12]